MKVSEFLHGARVLGAGRSETPKISIVLPTYKRAAEGLLTRCIESGIAQTFPDFELIVVDDGSSDGSEDIIQDFAFRDDRIIHVRHDRNSGLPAVRTNEGIMRARGDAVCFLFDDNIYDHDFLKHAWAELQRSQADVVYSKVRMLAKPNPDFELGGWPLSLELLRNLNTIPNGGVMVRRSFFSRYGLYDPHLLMRRVCDWDLWLRSLSLGARFAFLDFVSATEHGLVSPNSIGNTIAWDVKVVYAYMHDMALMRSRSDQLTPETIGDFDVLDPRPVTPYVRDAKEWRELTKTLYTPFLTRHDANGFDPDLPSNRAASVDPIEGWNADWSVIRRRRRILLVSNTVNAFVSAWIKALQDEPGAIVINCPEWQVLAFSPADVDLLILVDCATGFIQDQLDNFKASDVPILYVTGYGETPATAAASELQSRHFERVPEIASVLGAGIYFPQSGTGFGDRLEFARKVASRAFLLIGSPEAAAMLCYPDPVPLPAGTAEAADGVIPPSSIIAYDLGSKPHSQYDEVIVSPAAKSAVPSAGVIRRSWESVASLAESRPGAAIVVSSQLAQSWPPIERLGLSLLCKAASVQIRTADSADDDWTTATLPWAADAGAAAELNGWLRNLVKSAELARRLVKINNGPMRRASVSIFLNSDMFSGSEVYGLLIGRALARVGIDVQIVVPEDSPYAADRDQRRLDQWLVSHGMKAAVRAPYTPWVDFLQQDAGQRQSQQDALARFMDQQTSDVIICSGFMPVFADLPGRARLLIMSLFQASAYDQAKLIYLRNRIDGLISDCAWSYAAHRRVIGSPGAVVRTMLPLDEATRVLPKQFETTGRVRIAVGGTLQPRKRQIEAIAAVKLLQEMGYAVELNIYGYMLGLMQDYVRAMQARIVEDGLTDTVKCHGLVSLDEIARDNDIIFFPSIDESLPQTLAELMRLGLIAVCGLSGGIDELVRDGVTGYLTDDFSPNGMTQVLKRAIDDRVRWPGISTAAKAAVRDAHSEAGNTAALLDVMLEALQIETSPFGRLSATRE